MKKQIFTSIKFLLLMTVFLGVIYPFIIAGIGQLIFPYEANGTLIKQNEKIIGSALIGQKMDRDQYFKPRPSAVDYNTLPSGASNLGLTSQKLYNIVNSRKLEFLSNNSLDKKTKIPADVLFASGSGLDPHISVENAFLQINRIAEKRKFTIQQKDKLKSLVKNITEKPQFGILGSDRVNVFMLNLELNKIK